jgi:hypothetical protein
MDIFRLTRRLPILIGIAAALTAKPAALLAQDPPPATVIQVTRITSPIKDQSTRGTVLIVGAANSPLFSRYEVSYAAEPDAAVWILLGGSTRPVNNGVLQSWNTRPVPDGKYALRLQVFNSDATVNEVTVRNIALTNQAASTAQRGETSGATSRIAGAGNNEIETARSTIGQIGTLVNRLPASFSRGLRLGAYALAAFTAYALIRQLIIFFWNRFTRKHIDYGN